MSDIVGRVINYFQPCKRLAPSRRRSEPEFSRGFQPTEWLETVPACRERRRNSIVADATWESTRAYRGLKPTAKFKLAAAAEQRLHASKCLEAEGRPKRERDQKGQNALFVFFVLFVIFASLANSSNVAHGQEPQARIKIDIDRAIGEVHPHLFGNFAEHLGRMIYGGIYEEGSPLSDKEGVRLDVLEAVKGLNVSIL